MATNVLPPLSIGNITTFQGFTTTEAAKVHSPPSSLSKGRSGAHAHRLGGKGEGRGGRRGSGEVDALKEKGQKKSLLRDIDPARFVLALDFNMQKTFYIPVQLFYLCDGRFHGTWFHFWRARVRVVFSTAVYKIQAVSVTLSPYH